MVVVVVLGALLAATGVVGGIVNSIRPPDRFPPDSGAPGTTFHAVAVGDTAFAYIASPDAPVRLDDAELILDDRSVAAAIDLLACQRGDRSPVGSGVGATNIRTFCESIQRPAGQTLDKLVDGGETYLLAVITPLEPGRVLVKGVRVTHSRGPFHRTERTGQTIEVIAH